MKTVESSAVFQPKQWAKKEAGKTIENRTQPETCVQSGVKIDHCSRCPLAFCSSRSSPGWHQRHRFVPRVPCRPIAMQEHRDFPHRQLGPRGENAGGAKRRTKAALRRPRQGARECPRVAVLEPCLSAASLRQRRLRSIRGRRPARQGYAAVPPC